MASLLAVPLQLAPELTWLGWRLRLHPAKASGRDLPARSGDACSLAGRSETGTAGRSLGHVGLFVAVACVSALECGTNEWGDVAGGDLSACEGELGLFAFGPKQPGLILQLQIILWDRRPIGA